MKININGREIDTADIAGTGMQESSDTPARLTLRLRGYAADDPEGTIVVEGDDATMVLGKIRDAG